MAIELTTKFQPYTDEQFATEPFDFMNFEEEQHGS